MPADSGPAPPESPSLPESSSLNNRSPSEFPALIADYSPASLTLDPSPPPADPSVNATVQKLVQAAEQVGLPYDFSILSAYISSGSVGFSHPRTLRIHESTCSWNQYYPVLTFLFSGQLYADYIRMSEWLGLPNCSDKQWHRIIERLEQHVTELAEWSCSQVRQMIVQRGDAKKWVASFDGFYLTRGHYSNNASATIHDFKSGDITWFTHRTKRGPGHNWEGTSGGAEGDMLDELMGKVKDFGFSIKEIITDKDSPTNAIFCRHFPEGTITYCSNHCAKTLHKDLEKIKRSKCEVSYIYFIISSMLLTLCTCSVGQRTSGASA